MVMSNKGSQSSGKRPAPVSRQGTLAPAVRTPGAVARRGWKRQTPCPSDILRGRRSRPSHHPGPEVVATKATLWLPATGPARSLYDVLLSVVPAAAASPGIVSNAESQAASRPADSGEERLQGRRPEAQEGGTPAELPGSPRRKMLSRTERGPSTEMLSKPLQLAERGGRVRHTTSPPGRPSQNVTVTVDVPAPSLVLPPLGAGGGWLQGARAGWGLRWGGC